METIATHFREVDYQLAIMCNIYKASASMSAQIVLEQCSRCKVKLHKKKSKVKEQEKAPEISSSSADESYRAVVLGIQTLHSQ